MNDRLYRSRTERMLTGLCGGIAERLATDPTLVRIAFVILAFLTGGVFFLFYLVVAIIVPEEPLGTSYRGSFGAGPAGPPTDVAGGPPAAAGEAETGGAGGATAWQRVNEADRERWRAERQALRAERSATGAVLLGLLLILVGGFFVARRFLPALDVDLLWPVLLLALGVVLILASVRRRP